MGRISFRRCAHGVSDHWHAMPAQRVQQVPALTAAMSLQSRALVLAALQLFTGDGDRAEGADVDAGHVELLVGGGSAVGQRRVGPRLEHVLIQPLLHHCQRHLPERGEGR